MICISVTPESRQLARVDLLNASRFCDLIELNLDRLLKAPDVGELIQDVDKPVIVACRRPEDGGQWQGTDDERLALLRQAIISGPDYVELDLDTARQIPPFGDTRRVVAITNRNAPLSDVETLFDEAQKARADVVKFTALTPTFEAAWPLLKAVSRKRDIPVVAQGIGRCGITFALLGRKYGSPWIYAALEKGMEALPGQTTVFDLDDIYAWRSISSQTRFLGLVGFDVNQPLFARILNRGFEHGGLSFRCLPMQVQSLDRIPKQLDLLKIPGLIVNPALPLNLAALAERRDDTVQETNAADLLYRQDDVWHGYNLVGRVVGKSLEQSLAAQQRQLARLNVLVFGTNPLARSIIHQLQRRQGLVSVTSPDDRQGQGVARQMNVRHVPFANLYDTLCDVAVLTDPEVTPGHRKTELNPAFLRPELTVADVCRLPYDTPFIQEARDRRCRVVEPADLGFQYLTTLFKAVTGRELDRADFDAMIAE